MTDLIQPQRAALLQIPPARVIFLWNSVAENTGNLEQTLLKFADVLLQEAQSVNALPASAGNGGCA
ncbi:MAG: hypothetical protein ACRD1C_01920 [Terriglobales bacterium]